MVWRQIYVCKECKHITLGYFAAARMSLHQSRRKHKGLWGFRLNTMNIPSEKGLTPYWKHRILKIVEDYPKHGSPAEKRIFELTNDVRQFFEKS